MSIFLAGNEARRGALNVIPILDLPDLPNIVSEWAAIIPLVSHLATYREDYITTGEVALLGRVSIGLFPRLGTLSGLSRLLRRRPEFVDQASTKGGSNRTVWDVRWGSVFPAANGAAITAIIKYVLNRDATTAIMMPNNSSPSATRQPKLADEPKSLENAAVSQKLPPMARQPSIVHRQLRRGQILHVLHFERGQKKKSWSLAFERIRLTTPYRILTFILMTAIFGTLLVCGTYGTAVVLFTCAISRLLCPSVRIDRPAEYLMNNENHDACMLLASHQNALEWYLNVGDRSVVDTLLNKPMLTIPLEFRTRWIATWFYLAHLLQLAAMTFSAGNKGWDGVFLVALLACDLIIRWLFRGKILARNWLDREGISVELKSFEFEGRSTMIGAIQAWSRTDVSRWMDDILVPHPRRDAWLRNLGHSEEDDISSGHLGNADQEWVRRATDLSIASAIVLQKELNAKVV